MGKLDVELSPQMAELKDVQLIDEARNIMAEQDIDLVAALQEARRRRAALGGKVASEAERLKAEADKARTEADVAAGTAESTVESRNAAAAATVAEAGEAAKTAPVKGQNVRRGLQAELDQGAPEARVKAELQVREAQASEAVARAKTAGIEAARVQEAWDLEKELGTARAQAEAALREAKGSMSDADKASFEQSARNLHLAELHARMAQNFFDQAAVSTDPEEREALVAQAERAYRKANIAAQEALEPVQGAQNVEQAQPLTDAEVARIRAIFPPDEAERTLLVAQAMPALARFALAQKEARQAPRAEQPESPISKAMNQYPFDRAAGSNKRWTLGEWSSYVDKVRERMKADKAATGER
jgi:hypothetical protein